MQELLDVIVAQSALALPGHARSAARTPTCGDAALATAEED
ncbi:MAG: hypothetical protein RXR52_37885 [Paraburkholderia sp.]